jgi:hypothetical protein
MEEKRLTQSEEAHAKDAKEEKDAKKIFGVLGVLGVRFPPPHSSFVIRRSSFVVRLAAE